MDTDFKKLDWRQFELLCGSLLVAEGFKDLKQFAKPGQPDRGIDWIFEAPGGKCWIAQVKMFRRLVSSPSILRRAVMDIKNGLDLLNAEKAILMLSIPLSSKTRLYLLQDYDQIEIWDSDVIAKLLDKHDSIRQRFMHLIATQQDIEKLLESTSIRDETVDARANILISRLESVPTGKEGWRQYEDVCIDMLNYAFVPPLRLPKIQSWSEDGLDRRDAIYPIGNGNLFWESIKYEYSSRLVVAEFKNFDGPISQGEVESLQQYLLPKAKRAFGLLCSPKPPSISAIKARRRAWMIAENIILFLSNEDLKEIVRIRSDEGDPSEVLDAQMDEFFITLSP